MDFKSAAAGDNELLNLRGGSASGSDRTDCCYCISSAGYTLSIIATNYSECASDCKKNYPSTAKAYWYC